MFKTLKFLKNQSGVIHLIPLFLILIGIVAGVYLVSHPQIFKPKASSNIIEWQVGGSDNCITSVNPDNNYATANCSKLKLKFNLPAQSSDAGPNISLVRTAYAAGSGIDYFCKDDTTKIYHRGCSWPLNLCLTPIIGQFAYKDEPENCDAGSVCTPNTLLGIKNGAECKKQQVAVSADDSRVRQWFCKDDHIFRRYVDENNQIQDVDEKDCSNYSGGCENYYNQDKAIQDARCAGSIESAPNPYTTNENTVRWFCKDEKIWREFIPDPSKPYKTSTIQDSDCGSEGKACEEYYNTDEKKNDAKCVAKTAETKIDLTGQPVPAATTAPGTSAGRSVTPPAPATPSAPPAPPTTATTVPTTAPTASRKIVKYRYQVSYPPTKQSGWINITGGDISIDTENASSGTQMIIFEFADSNEQIVEVDGKSSVTAYVTFVAPGQPAAPTAAPGAQVPTAAPATTPTTLSAELFINPSIVIKTASGTYPKIRFDVYGANKNWTLYYHEIAGANCGGNCTLVGWADFPHLTGVEGAGSGGAGNATVYWTAPAYVTGTHTIALIDNSVIIQKDVTFQDNTPAGSIAAGSECSAYATTLVCGSSSQTYDKCIDEKGQSGSSLCSNGASKFYCVGSTNSNCDSRYDGTQKKVVEGTYQYSCSACPNLIDRSSSQNGD